MLGIKFAGDRLRDLDTAYADAVYNPEKPFRAMTSGIPLSEFNGRYTTANDYEAAGGIGPRTQGDARNAAISDAVYLTANVASRYVLPAGGVTLAGKALHDLSGNLFALSAEDAEQYAQAFERNDMPEYAATMRASQASTQGELPM